MEEAEVLCDRLGIFVDGSLQCIGNPKEVKHILYLNGWKQRITVLTANVFQT